MQSRAGSCQKSADSLAKSNAPPYGAPVLLRFGMENHTCFREPAELSFVSTAQADTPSFRLPNPHAPHGVLPVLGIWGANASGKSNLLRALITLRNHVRDSFVGHHPDDPLPWRPFAMRAGTDAAPTRLDLDVMVDDVRHHYGLRLRAAGFLEEWLFAWPSGRKQVLFHRNHDERDPWYFGPNLGGQRRHIARATRPNSLFLSAAAQYNHEQLTPLYNAITQGIRTERRIEPRGFPLFEASSPVLEPRLQPAVLGFLRAADLGIVGMRSRELSSKVIVEQLQPPQSIGLRLFELRLRHGTADDEASWELPPDQESRGTQVLLRRIEDFLEVLGQGGVLLLDELDTSLHPDLCAQLVGFFCDPAINRQGAQLLFTTHDRSLLATLRRDEVVLIDKAPDGSSTLRTASDYAGIRGRDDLRRAHELGRIRGIPILGDLAGVVARGLSPDAP